MSTRTVAGLALGVVVLPFAAAALPVTLSDGAAELQVTGRNGATVWKLDDGPDNLFLNNWYLRAEGDGQELPLSEFVAAPVLAESAPASATLRFEDGALGASLRWDLSGGPSGSGRSRVTSTLTLENEGAAPLALFVFGYSDYDIRFDQFAQSDQATLIAPETILTRSATFPITITTTVSPAPTSWEIGAFFDLYSRFFIDLDGPTTLPSTPAPGVPFPAPPGDNAFAFGWETTIAPGDAWTVSQTSEIAPIPLPAPALALLAGLAALGVAARRRRG